MIRHWDIQIFRLTAYVAAGPSRPNFAFPLFSDVAATKPNDLFIQKIDGVSGLISSFVPLNTSEKLVSVSNGPKAMVGGQQIYTFLDAEKATFGTASEIKPTLLHAKNQAECTPALILQISELVGTHDEIIKARLVMRNLIEETLGREAAMRFVTSSLLRTSLWDILVRCAKTGRAANSVLVARTRLGITTDEGGKVALDLSAIDLSEFDKSLREIERQLEAELRGYRGTVPKHSAERNPKEIADAVSEWVRLIGYQSRQEARLAIALRALLEDREVGVKVLELYRPYAQYERRALAEVVSLVQSFPTADLERVLAQAIPRQLQWAFSKNRGIALLHLATELGAFRHMRQAIENELYRSGSLDIALRRPLIESALRAARHGDH